MSDARPARGPRPALRLGRLGVLAAGVAAAAAAVLVIALGNGPDLDRLRAEPAPGASRPSPADPRVHVSVFLCGAGACDEAATSADKAGVDRLLGQLDGVGDVHFVDREEAYRRFVDVFADRPDLLDTVTPSDLPESYEFTVPASRYDEAAERLRGLPGVDSVDHRPTPPTAAPPATATPS